MTIESLVKAQHDAEFAVQNLRAALSGGGSVAALLVLPLIAKAAELERGIKELRGALEADSAEARR